MENKELQEKAQEETLNFEREIKMLIIAAILSLSNRNSLILTLNKKITEYEKALPEELIDRDKYIEGAYFTTMMLVNNYYDKVKNWFIPTEEVKIPKDYLFKKKTNSEYGDLLIKTLKGLNKQELVYSEKGKRPITLWQKTELDIRHEEQMKMVQEASESGKDLFWLSSHANCSKRCAKFQGKLVSLTLKSIDSSFYTGKNIDGIRVYSFTDIENQVDKYGYKNNIINGFNCRHSLIAYSKSGEKPTQYSKGEINKTISNEAIQRKMEVVIRKKKDELQLLKITDKEKAKILEANINKLVEEYKTFCNKRKLEIQEYRIS